MICASLTREQSNRLYREVLGDKDSAAMRRLCTGDLFFLLTVACKRPDIDRDWLYERCRDVEANPNGFLDLWARDHYKSTIITFGKTLQDILGDQEITVGIFSHTRPIAKGFLGQIKYELESNEFLKALFPDVLYQNPKSESPSWSLDGGITVKRKTNPKEKTVEAWGLVDGQPTSRHFRLRVYDDVVTLESVSTPDQIKKTTVAWELSQNLGSMGGHSRHIGTRYHLFDTYRDLMDRGSVKPRIHPATRDGTVDGEPVLLTREVLMEKRRDQGPYTFGTQMLQNPVADRAMSFKEEWLRFYENVGDLRKMNLYLIVDPASKKKKTSDYTTMRVIGLAPDQNYYLIEAIRDRLNLTQRADKVFEFHRKYERLTVGYEEYGLQADIEHIKYRQEQESYRFDIIALGGQVAKEDRIKMLIPIYEQGRFWLPKSMPFVDHERMHRDYVREFIRDEYTAFPVCVHDDMLDGDARILDPTLGAKFPKVQKPQPPAFFGGGSANSWMG